MRRALRPDPRRGVVLVAVLWTIALLSALAMAAGVGFRGFAGALAIDHDRAQAEALFSAGLEVGADLLAKYGGRPLTPVETRLALPRGAVRVRLSDELGRIDVNKAPAEVFTSLLSEIGVLGSAEVAAAIVRWRDGEKIGGARAQEAKTRADETTAHSQGGKPKQKRTYEQVFTNLDQLTQVPEVTPEIVRRIAPYATVFGDEKINAATASRQVLRALPAMTAAHVDQLLEARGSGPIDSAGLDRLLGPASQFAQAANHTVARLEMTVALVDGYAAAAEAIIVILPKDRQPYRVLSFRRSPTPLSYGARRHRE
jgi:general secretion pathway protein K